MSDDGCAVNVSSSTAAPDSVGCTSYGSLAAFALRLVAPAAYSCAGRGRWVIVVYIPLFPLGLGLGCAPTELTGKVGSCYSRPLVNSFQRRPCRCLEKGAAQEHASRKHVQST